MRTKFWLLLALAAILLPGRTATARVWTSSNGEHRIEAELVGFDAERVRLKKRDDGKIVVVPLDQLGESDQKWIAELVARQAAAKAVLEKRGFRISSDGLQVPEELELKNGLRDLPPLKKAVLDADRKLESARKQVDDNRGAVEKLIEANRQLNAQLAMIRPTQITLNNKLVAAIQANKAQIVLTQEQGKKLEKQVETARGEAAQTRATFLEAVGKLRTLVVDIIAKYEESAKEDDVAAAVAAMNEALPGTYVLGESRTLAASIRELEKLQEHIDSDSIPLRSVAGRLVVSAVINDKHNYDMIVDAGSSLVVLPLAIAGQCGIEVKESDQNARLAHADGKIVLGKVVTISSLQVGRFTAKEVKCVVLGIDALNAQPLLGKSFLEKFQYEVDAQKCTLTLIEVAPEAKPPAP
ncbi:MAG: hypothetical protein GXX96_10660 [Planctomycetaceae bacterium]|mgnify:CR=1 FL=1|nr:hypothetical protein [Planctomycetaceae bacterium]